MKLLLTSTGFKNLKIGRKFLRLIKKHPSKLKIIFIPIAARTKEELKYVEVSKKELLDLGIKNIRIIDLNKKIDYSELKNFDAMYICGGNTFYLMYKIRRINFNKIIKKFVKEGKIYVGVSAGSIIAGPNIKIASPFDKNDVGLKDLKGLNLTNVIVSPHFCKKEENIIKKFKKKSKYKVIPLTDKQALLIKRNKIKIIE